MTRERRYCSVSGLVPCHKKWDQPPHKWGPPIIISFFILFSLLPPVLLRGCTEPASMAAARGGRRAWRANGHAHCRSWRSVLGARRLVRRLLCQSAPSPRMELATPRELVGPLAVARGSPRLELARAALPWLSAPRAAVHGHPARLLPLARGACRNPAVRRRSRSAHCQILSVCQSGTWMPLSIHFSGTRTPNMLKIFIS